MPLSSWKCDVCGDAISNPQQALVTWQEDEDHKAYDFLLVHKNIEGRHCDPGGINGYSSSMEVDYYLGADGQAALLSMLSIGPIKDRADDDPRVRDIDAFVDLFRRLQTPWYEEARSHFADEATQHWLGDANESLPYHPDVLEQIAKGTLGQ